MSHRRKSVIAAAGLASCLAASLALAQGPDVIVGDMPTVQYWGEANGIKAFSIATTSCNIGNQQLLWIQNNNQHPVIAQNMYRVMDGRLEQIGMSWLKHGFCALQGTVCGACQPAGGGCIDRLGIGCSDPYSASLNGEQARLGPRNHVQPFTGHFPYPFTSPGPGYTAPPPAPATIGRRLQVPATSTVPASNPGAIYFLEGQYVTADDANAGNGRNNASYRRVAFNSTGTVVTMVGSTQRQRPAIQGWKDLDPAVSLATADVPGEGRFYVAGKAVDNGDGTWTYNYAVFNLNSHTAARSFSVPLQCGANPIEDGFRAPLYHSGEPFSNDPWNKDESAFNAMRWSTQPFAENANANALRWGTTYTFWVTVAAPPVSGSVTLGLFRTEGSLTVAGLVVPGPANCRGDWTGSDGVNSADISAYLTDWLQSVQNGTTEADFDCDGAVNSSDISAFIASWLNDVINGGC